MVKRLLSRVLLLAIPIWLVAIYNLYLDPFCVLRKNIADQVTEPNQHFLKMDYVLRNPSRFDSYIFGSSRAANIDVRKIRPGRFYNMYYPGGLPEEWFRDIRRMVEKGVSVRRVLIALDDFSFQNDPKSHERCYLRRPYPESDGELMKFYLFYLFQKPDFDLLKLILKQRDAVHNIVYDLYGSGLPLKEFRDREIDGDPEAHLRSKAFLNPPVSDHFQLRRLEETVRTLISLREFCARENIELLVILNPVIKSLCGEHYEILRKRMARVFDFWDFSGPNSITSNNFYFYETVHYRPVVGDMIISKVFNQSIIDVPSDFGKYVKKNAGRL